MSAKQVPRRTSLSRIYQAVGYIGAWLAGAGATAYVGAHAEAVQAYAILCGWWVAFTATYIFDIRPIAILLWLPAILVLDTIAVSNGIGYHDAPGTWTDALPLAALRTALFMSPNVTAAALRAVLIGLGAVDASGTRSEHRKR